MVCPEEERSAVFRKKVLDSSPVGVERVKSVIVSRAAMRVRDVMPKPTERHHCFSDRLVVGIFEMLLLILS